MAGAAASDDASGDCLNAVGVTNLVVRSLPNALVLRHGRPRHPWPTPRKSEQGGRTRRSVRAAGSSSGFRFQPVKGRAALDELASTAPMHAGAAAAAAAAADSAASAAGAAESVRWLGAGASAQAGQVHTTKRTFFAKRHTLPTKPLPCRCSCACRAWISLPLRAVSQAHPMFCAPDTVRVLSRCPRAHRL